MIISASRTHSCLEDVNGFPGALEDLVIFGIKFDIKYNLHISWLSCMPFLSSLAWLKMYQEHSHTWRMLMVPDWCLGELNHLWYHIFNHESNLYVILELYANFQLQVWLEFHQEYGYTWRMLMVPDWSWWWFGQPCCFGSS